MSPQIFGLFRADFIKLLYMLELREESNAQRHFRHGLKEESVLCKDAFFKIFLRQTAGD